MSNSSYTKGEPYIITLVENEGERSRHIHYLLSNGTRRRVTIDVSHDSETMRQTIGAALAVGNYKRGRK